MAGRLVRSAQDVFILDKALDLFEKRVKSKAGIWGMPQEQLLREANILRARVRSEAYSFFRSETLDK